MVQPLDLAATVARSGSTKGRRETDAAVATRATRATEKLDSLTNLLDRFIAEFQPIARSSAIDQFASYQSPPDNGTPVVVATRRTTAALGKVIEQAGQLKQELEQAL